MPPQVSVIIPTFNCCHLLRDAIESALAQNYSNLEIIVVDDGSTDATADVCASYTGKIAYSYQQNAGTPAARNKGISLSTGKYIALLDHDDLWLPGKIQQQVAVMESDAEIGLVHTGGRVVDLTNGQVTSTYFPQSAIDYHDIRRWCMIGCATVMIRRSALDEVGVFDETLQGVDDWDLWIRLAWSYRLVGISHVLAVIREHSSNQGKRYKRMYPIVRRCIEKSRPIHTGCRECAQALQAARKRLRLDFYVKACAHSRELRRTGSWIAATFAWLDGYRIYPEGIFNCLRHLKNQPAT